MKYIFKVYLDKYITTFVIVFKFKNLYYNIYFLL